MGVICYFNMKEPTIEDYKRMNKELIKIIQTLIKDFENLLKGI